MQRALDLATQAIGVSDPNPRVGCVITDAHGQVLGEGSTQQAGGPHAEVMALRDATARGHDVRGSTAYVTLEPCSHHGRTPPCCDALIRAGLRRVVAAAVDPNVLVAGQGLERLRAAGIDVSHGLLESNSQELNIGFFSRMQRGRPWVRLKAAVSLDGRSALHNGDSQWITSEAARADGHAWRRRAGAVLTGIGTVTADRPRLDVRLVPTQIQPLRVVLDSALSIPDDAPILQAPGKALLVAADPPADRLAMWRSRGQEVLLLPNAQGQVDLPALMLALGERGINELHVEAGRTLSGAMIAAGCVDEYLVYIAPKLLGEGRGLADLPALERVNDASTLQFHQIDRVGADLRLLLRR